MSAYQYRVVDDLDNVCMWEIATLGEAIEVAAMLDRENDGEHYIERCAGWERVVLFDRLADNRSRRQRRFR